MIEKGQEMHPNSAQALYEAQQELREAMGGEFEASASESPTITAKRREQAEQIVKARQAEQYEAAIAAEMKKLREQEDA